LWRDGWRVAPSGHEAEGVPRWGKRRIGGSRLQITEMALSIFPATSRFRRRHKRCYESAFRTLLELEDASRPAGAVLVHGTATLRGGTIGTT
jgi:hypothetical protein